jgi:dynein heavy chain 1
MLDQDQDPDATSANDVALSTQRKLRSKRSTMLLSVVEKPAVDVPAAVASKRSDQRPVLRPCVHEIRLKNQVMYLDPPIEEAKSNWYEMLDEWLCMSQWANVV